VYKHLLTEYPVFANPLTLLMVRGSNKDAWINEFESDELPRVYMVYVCVTRENKCPVLARALLEVHSMGVSWGRFDENLSHFPY